MTRRHLGSTDAAVILGRSPWRSAHDLWRALRGAPEREAGPAMLRGLACEPFLAARVSRLVGAQLEPVPPVLQPHGRRFMRVSGDYRVGRIGYELKTSGFYAHDRWAGLPEYYEIQCVIEAWAHDMAEVVVPTLVLPSWVGAAETATLTMTPEARLAAINALAPVIVEASEIQVYRVERDDDYAEAIVRIMGAWWHRYIVEGEEPTVTATDEWRDYARTELVQREPLRDATDDEAALMLAYDEARAAATEATRRQADIGERIRRAIGTAEGMKARGLGHAVARPQKARTDWRAVATELGNMLALRGADPRETIERFTTPGEGRTLDVRIKAARSGEEET